MLFWSGLRGAVGVALAAGITGDNADALRTTILVVVVLTVIVFGGTTARMLEVLGIRVGVEDEDASSDEDEGWRRPIEIIDLHSPPARSARLRSGFSSNSEESDDEPLATFPPPVEPGEPGPGMVFRDGQWFTALDERYLLPLFSNSVTARRAHAKKAKKASVYSETDSPRDPSPDIEEAPEAGERESENGKLKGLPRTFR
jgi:sodium/hydrogen exchanger-like protein 6/7